MTEGNAQLWQQIASLRGDLGKVLDAVKVLGKTVDRQQDIIEEQGERILALESAEETRDD